MAEAREVPAPRSPGEPGPAAAEADRARAEADLAALQARYGPPQPRDPRKGQLVLELPEPMAPLGAKPASRKERPTDA